MNKLDNNRLTMCEDVVRFLRQPEIKLSDGGLALLEELEKNKLLVKELGRNQVSGDGTINLAVQTRERVAAGLRALMRSMVAVVHEFTPPAKVPGVSEPFQMPKKKRYQDLLNSARAFVQALEPNRAFFVQHLGEEEVNQLPILIEEFESGSDHKRAGREGRQLSTASISVALERSVRIVRLLNAIVRRTMRDNPAIVATLKRIARVRTPSRANGDTTPAPAPNGGGTAPPAATSLQPAAH